MADQQYCLRWNNHQSTLISVFDSLQERGCMVDCTLAAEGQSLQAHKVVLSACSPYLEDLLSKHYDKHPILLLKDVKFEELKAMMDYMYRGEVNVAQDKLNTFLRAAESLQIKGLSDGGTDPPDSGGTTSTKRTAKGTPVSVRSNQLTVRKTNLDDSSSRDGSTSPSQRKRRRRRGSETSDIETSNVSDGKQSTAAAAPVSGPSETSPIVPASAPSDDNILSSITESAETENATDSGFSSAVPQEINNVIRDRDNALIEPKTEYVEDDGQDLNLEDEDGLFRAGPSHARGTYEGDGDDDVYMTNQDSGANAQGWINARMKLAHGLHALTETLRQPSVTNENDLPVLEGLTENIKHAVIRLNGSFESRTEASERNRIGKSADKGIKSKKKPGPKCKKIGPKRKDKKISVSICSALDLDGDNKIWLVPEIKLTDVVKTKVIKTEESESVCA